MWVILIALPCLVLLLLLLALGIVLGAYSKQKSEPTCPECGHTVLGLIKPVCPECGGSLEAGVVKPRTMPPRSRRLVGIVTLLTGGLVTLAAIPLGHLAWSELLHSLGLMQVSTQFECTATPRSMSGGGATYKRKPGDPLPYIFDFTVTGELLDMEPEEGEVRLVILRDEDEVASWSGFGEPLPEPHGVVISGVDAVESLREQIPAETGTPLAGWLHDEEDSAVLADVIEAIAADPSSSSAVTGLVGWKTRDGTQIFDGAGAFGETSGTELESTGALMTLWFLIPVAFAAGTILWGVWLLQTRRALQPFDSVGRRHTSD